MRKHIEKAAKLARIAIKEDEIPAIEQAFTGLMAHFEHLGTIEEMPDIQRSSVRLRADECSQTDYQPDWESRETKGQALVIPRVMD